MANNFKFSKKRRVASSYKVIDDNSTSFTLRKIFKREVTLTLMSIVGVTIIMIGGSYSIFSTITRSEDSSVLKTGTLALEFNDTDKGLGNIISLNGEYPISDSEGLKKDPYTFKITNTGSINATYKIQILDDSSMIEEDGCINELLRKEVIKYSIDGSNPLVLANAKDGVIKTGILKGGESAVHSIKMWISDLAENTDLGKHYHGKILVEAVQEEMKGSNTLGLPSTTNVNYNDTVDSEKHGMFEFSTKDGVDYRYIGKDPYNYLMFEGDTSNSLFRIIGVFNDSNSSGDKSSRIKIIQNNNIGDGVWDINNSNDWSKASLNNLLNTGEYYQNLSPVVKEKIEEMDWYLGSVSDGSVDTLYKEERESSNKWKGNIGLLYLSDIYYTYSKGVNDLCYSNLFDGNNCKLNKDSWLSLDDNSYMWTINKQNDLNNVLSFNSNVSVSNANSSGSIHPVFYLKDSVTIIRGDGSSSNPYVIGR